MSNIFYLPRAQSLPGAKLTFTISGTTTPQNTYQDVDLTTPHANPVVADASGYFAPIYLDPSLPNYRMKLTTSADVLIVQYDDILATPVLNGSFTGNLTGFTATSTTGVKWAKIGSIVVVTIEGKTGTSNATSFTLNNLPDELVPLSTFANCAIPPGIDNGATATDCSAAVSSGSNVITFSRNASAFGWTASGTKGISNTTITYSLV